MATFQFELVSPERLLLSEEVDSVLVPGAEGEFTVFAGHAPVMSTIKPGLLSVTSGSTKTDFVLFGGFAEVGPAGLTVLAESAIEKSSIDKADLAQRIQNAQEDVSDATNDEARAAAQERLAHLTQLQSML